MKMLVIGAGKMGRVIARDLAENPDVEKVTVADRDTALARRVAAELARGIGEARELDARDEKGLAELMKGQTVVVGAADYRFNEVSTRLAIEAGAHFCDLGGNNTVVRRQLAMDPAAREAGVCVVPDCGVAPGMVCILAADGVSRLDSARRISIRVGGLPTEPKGPLKYLQVFSIRGLTNEYLEPALVVRGGTEETVRTLTELESLEFPEPFGELEAFQTSGGTSTLPQTFAGKVPEIDYKTIRYRGHCEKIQLLRELGYFDDRPVTVGGVEVSPREVSEAVLERHFPQEGADVLLLRVVVEGSRGGRDARLRYQCVEYGDEKNRYSAMARMTSFPASIVAQMLGDGRIEKRGAVPQELAVPSPAFLEELAKRRVRVEITES